METIYRKYVDCIDIAQCNRINRLFQETINNMYNLYVKDYVIIFRFIRIVQTWITEGRLLLIQFKAE